LYNLSKLFGVFIKCFNNSINERNNTGSRSLNINRNSAKCLPYLWMVKFMDKAVSLPMEWGHVNDNIFNNNKTQRIRRKVLFILIIRFNIIFFFNRFFDVKLTKKSDKEKKKKKKTNK
jgi:hypothetical protein